MDAPKSQDEIIVEHELVGAGKKDVSILGVARRWGRTTGTVFTIERLRRVRLFGKKEQ